MKTRDLIKRSLLYHWRSHVAVVLCVVTGTSVLSGALLVGDSMRGSLRDLTLDRLGRVDYALRAGRVFRQALVELVNYTRNSQYRCHGTEDFSPYDSATWDAFFDELTQGLTTRIQTIHQQVGQLEIPELTLQTDINNKWWQILQETRTTMEAHLSEVEVFLDAGYVEMWIEQKNPV